MRLNFAKNIKYLNFIICFTIQRKPKNILDISSIFILVTRKLIQCNQFNKKFFFKYQNVVISKILKYNKVLQKKKNDFLHIYTYFFTSIHLYQKN